MTKTDALSNMRSSAQGSVPSPVKNSSQLLTGVLLVRTGVLGSVMLANPLPARKSPLTSFTSRSTLPFAKGVTWLARPRLEPHAAHEGGAVGPPGGPAAYVPARDDALRAIGGHPFGHAHDHGRVRHAHEGVLPPRVGKELDAAGAAVAAGHREAGDAALPAQGVGHLHEAPVLLARLAGGGAEASPAASPRGDGLPLRGRQAPAGLDVALRGADAAEAAARAEGVRDDGRVGDPFPSRAPATEAWPAVTVVFAFAPHLPRLVAPDPSASIVLALGLVSPARLANSARLTSLGSGGPPGAKPMPPRASSMIPRRPLRSLRLTSVVPLTPACRQKPVQVAQRRSGRLRLLWVATLFRLYVAIIARLQQRGGRWGCRGACLYHGVARTTAVPSHPPSHHLALVDEDEVAPLARKLLELVGEASVGEEP